MVTGISSSRVVLSMVLGIFVKSCVVQMVIGITVKMCCRYFTWSQGSLNTLFLFLFSYLLINCVCWLFHL